MNLEKKTKFKPCKKINTKNLARNLKFFVNKYWHASPKIYSQNDIIAKKPAKEIWERDEKCIQYLKEKFNLDIKIIWQDEIKNQQIVNELINWIFK